MTTVWWNVFVVALWAAVMIGPRQAMRMFVFMAVMAASFETSFGLIARLAEWESRR